MLQTYMQVMGLLKNLRYDFNISVLNNMEIVNLKDSVVGYFLT